MGCCRRRGAADGRGDGWAERDCIFPSGGVPAWNVCCSSSLRARGGQVIPLQFPPLAGQRGGGCCCFVQARGCCVHSLQLTPTHGERKGGGKTKSRARIVGGLWHGVLLCWEWGQRFGTLEAACSVCLMLKQLCLIGVMRSGQFSAHPWKLGAGKSHCRPQGRVWLCVCCSAQGWQALCL